MAEAQLVRTLQLVQGIAGKQQANEARLQGTEAAIEKLVQRSEEAAQVKVKTESFEDVSREGLRLEEAEHLLEEQRKYVLGRRRGAKGSGSSITGRGSPRHRYAHHATAA